ncbi:MAG: A/G-specific adenine glycosylase [Cytophagales bacterium]|nr:A/G-specific adenine glycosylase [Cytophagales bacterium]
MASLFSRKVIAWQATHGRHSLPWQMRQGPYSVWLSEVMLQQTQVATVQNFYPQFLAKFPTVKSLAAAPLDDVLALWSGMGYYTRARNLHRAANQVMTDFGGEFPKTAEGLEQLVGVGRSTAAAIAAFCYGERVAILDGNVKRVLARVLAFEGDLANAAQVRLLWDKAIALLPTHNLKKTMPAYTQGLMDMGATLCHARAPDCVSCPVASICKASISKACEAYPIKKKKLKRSTESIWLLHATRKSRQGDAVLLQQRPLDGASKVWAGLFSLPPFASEAALQAAVPQALHPQLVFQPVFKHVLTHKDMWLHVVRVQLPANSKLPAVQGDWFALGDALLLGLPAPIRKLLAAQ